MKSPYLSELQPNKVVVGIFLVLSKDIRQKKSGEPYLSMVLGDRTGEIDAKMWDNVGEVMDTFDRDDFVRVKGLLQAYNNRPQFTVHKIMRVEESSIDPADYFPVSARDAEAMYAELREIVCSIGNPHLKGLLELFLADEEICARYRKAPAAKHIHHAFLGGLLEHVLSVCRLCRLTAGQYDYIDIDLLLAGAILHDIGKVYELDYDRSFGYSSEGQLLGHIALSLRMIDQKIQMLPEFPARLRTLLEHMILSHHGHLEFGSPKLPMFPEALLLHYLDDLDSKMECMRALIQQDRQTNGCWTGYSPALERVVLNKIRYLSGQSNAEEMEATAPAQESVAVAEGELVPVGSPAPQPGSPSTTAAGKDSQPAPEPARSNSFPAPLKPIETPQRDPGRRPGDRSTTMSLFGERLRDALKEK